MYSGTTFRTKSGRMMGVHQRIDRLARRVVTHELGRTTPFPGIRDILHYEGKNGPDGIKSKSPGQDEPWHYIDPTDPSDTMLLAMIDDHIYNLTQALREKNEQRAAFEAAWLAHAVTDGLTPAHHYPLEKKLTQLRGGLGLETRSTRRQKIVLPGETRRLQLMNNWEMWGAKGIMTTHFNFELGIMTTLAAQRYRVTDFHLPPTERAADYRSVYVETVKRVADMAMYEEFTQRGWTRHLARETREVLIPLIVDMVALGWLVAAREARKAP